MKRRLTRLSKIVIVLMAVFLLAFVVMDSVAFARAGGGRSSGSRGFSSGTSSRSYQGYGTTGTSQSTQQPGTTPQTSSPGMGRSLMYGLGGGLLGGMFGSMLFGGRGGWGAGGFGMGDFIIIIIILGIVYFVVKRYHARRQEMEMGGTGAGYTSSSYAYNEPEPAAGYAGYGSAAQGGAVSEGLRHIMSTDPAFTEAGFKEATEDNFFRIQGAWTKRDLAPIRSLLTPEMLTAFQEQVSQAVAAKQLNRLENIAVRQVEIVDAVQDQGEEYLTVKFLASLLDYTVNETTDQVVSGSPTEPVKFLEYWTFTRHVGDRSWLLAGITQEGDYQ